jgi:tetratricopeptide (TPR) repeat protein
MKRFTILPSIIAAPVVLLVVLIVCFYPLLPADRRVIAAARTRKGDSEKISVFPFTLKKETFIYRWLSEGSAEIIADKLSVVKSLEVIVPDDMNLAAKTIDRCRENGFSLQEGLSLATICSCDYAIVGTVDKYGSDLTISSDLIDVHTGKVIFSFKRREPYGKFLDITNALVFNVIQHLDCTISISEIQRIERAPTRSFIAYRSYMDALSLFDPARGSETLDIRIGLLLKSIQMDSTFVKPHIHLGEAYMRKDEYGKAKTHYLNAITHDPENASAKIGLAEVYFEEGEYQKVIEEISPLMKHNPMRSEVLFYLGRSHLHLGHVEKAEQLLTSYRELTGDVKADTMGKHGER